MRTQLGRLPSPGAKFVLKIIDSDELETGQHQAGFGASKTMKPMQQRSESIIMPH